MKNKILIILMCLFIGFLWAGILTHTVKKVAEEPTIPEYTQTTDVALMTSDAVQLEGTCTWHLDVPSTDVDRLKIDLIISRTIQKSMTKYSYEDLLNNDEAIFKDIQERVEDCVFSIQPYGFTVWVLSINKPENVILK
jgi:hypothetical protein